MENVYTYIKEMHRICEKCGNYEEYDYEISLYNLKNDEEYFLDNMSMIDTSIILLDKEHISAESSFNTIERILWDQRSIEEKRQFKNSILKRSDKDISRFDEITSELESIIEYIGGLLDKKSFEISMLRTRIVFYM